jgi:predicted nucleic acid-binding protein
VIQFVLDASVAAKWYLPAAGEPLAEEARTLLRRYVGGEIGFVVPDFFWAECANVLWKAMRQGRISRSAAGVGAATLASHNFPTTASRNLLNEAFRLATTFHHSVYDCFYVALALRSQAPLVTADEKLANALAAHLPVKWLGSV